MRTEAPEKKVVNNCYQLSLSVCVHLLRQDSSLILMSARLRLEDFTRARCPNIKARIARERQTEKFLFVIVIYEITFYNASSSSFRYFYSASSMVLKRTRLNFERFVLKEDYMDPARVAIFLSL